MISIYPTGDSEGELQQLTDRLEKVLAGCEMEISWEESKLLVNSSNPGLSPSIKRMDRREGVDDFECLGSAKIFLLQHFCFKLTISKIVCCNKNRCALPNMFQENIVVLIELRRIECNFRIHTDLRWSELKRITQQLVGFLVEKLMLLIWESGLYPRFLRRRIVVGSQLLETLERCRAYVYFSPSLLSLSLA